MLKLSILVPTLADRNVFLMSLLSNLNKELLYAGAKKDVEILIDDRGRQWTTGEKRNDLLSRAAGEYVWFIDDDDEILPGAMQSVLKAMDKKPDVIGINGYMTTNGTNKQGFEIRLEHPYKAEIRDGKEFYLRFPNHITPMKRIHAITQQFPHKTFAEDYAWALAMHNSGVLKTQVVIKQDVYHYKLRTNK